MFTIQIWQMLTYGEISFLIFLVLFFAFPFCLSNKILILLTCLLCMKSVFQLYRKLSESSDINPTPKTFYSNYKEPLTQVRIPLITEISGICQTQLSLSYR